MRILVLVDHYLPGFKAGGTPRAVAALVERLGDEFEFAILTRDRDLNDGAPYPGVQADRWTRVGKAGVYYGARDAFTLGGLRRLLSSTPFDVLYVNSLFSLRFSIAPLLVRKARGFPIRPVVLAPRGGLSPGALSIRSTKKRAFLEVARRTGLHDGILWQASSRVEAGEIAEHFGSSAPVRIAEDVLPPVTVTKDRVTAEKRAGRLRAVFLSRIVPKKNLEGAIRILSRVRSDASLDVYGPAEDPDYWARCREAARALPPNVRMEYRGELRPEEIARVFGDYDLFLFPTLGENFGYVILEALQAGCPVLLSDRTPWRGLEAARAGWDLPLEDEEGFVRVLERCAAMGPDEHARWSAQARAYGSAKASDPGPVEQHRNLFREAAGGIRDGCGILHRP